MNSFLLLMIQGYRGRKDLLADPGAVRRFLEAAVIKLDMIPLQDPVVHNFDYALEEAEKGVSGLELIAEARFIPPGGASGVAPLKESHIAVHTWPEKRFGSFLFFSCKDFEKTKALSLTRKSFGFLSQEYLPIKCGFEGIFSEWGKRVGRRVGRWRPTWPGATEIGGF